MLYVRETEIAGKQHYSIQEDSNCSARNQRIVGYIGVNHLNADEFVEAVARPQINNALREVEAWKETTKSQLQEQIDKL